MDKKRTDNADHRKQRGRTAPNKAIERRAEKYVKSIEYIYGNLIEVQEECRKYGYIKGATEQREIDFKFFKKWLEENLPITQKEDAEKMQYKIILPENFKELIGDLEKTMQM